MTWKIAKKRILRKSKLPGAAKVLLGFCSLLAMALIIRSAMRRARRRISGSAPQPFHHLRESLEYRAPVEKVFGIWTAFADFPKYLEEVAWARETGPSRFRFGLRNPSGEIAIWEVIVTRLVPGQYLEWYSTSKSPIQCSGRARFRNRPDAAHVDFEIEFGHGLGWMVDGLERFIKDDMPKRLEADAVRARDRIDPGFPGHRRSASRSARNERMTRRTRSAVDARLGEVELTEETESKLA